jgi:hypothetical protein
MIAQMVKLVDTPASGAGDLTVVEVRVFFWAPIRIQGYDLECHKNPRKRVFAFLPSEKFHAPCAGAAEGNHGTVCRSGTLQGAFEKQYRLSLLQVIAMRQ